MGKGCFLLLFPISHLVDVCLALPPSPSGLSFCLCRSPSLHLVWLCVFGLFATHPFLEAPLRLLLLCSRHRPALGSASGRSRARPLPQPLPDSGPSHLRGKVNI